MVRVSLLTYAIASSMLLASRLEAQATLPSSYLSGEIGVALEPGQFSVRSPLGYSVAAGIGRQLSAHGALEGRFGGEFFDSAPEFVSPGGCLAQGPCVRPLASPVHIITFAGNLVVSGDLRQGRPLMVVGAGFRHITESPEHPPELRPFAEIGGGIARSDRAYSIGLDVRLQLAASTANLPRWTLPCGLSVRFF
jgi:hypothetical protein